MKNVKYLIIGGGIAGTTAAGTIREKDEKSTVTIVSDEPYRLYSRVMLSKPGFFLEKIPFDKIWMKDEKWYADNNINLMAGKKAVKLDVENKIVVLNDGEEIKYEKLLLAIGGHNRKLPIPGIDKKGVVYLRGLDDAKEIITQVKSAKSAVIIGGGFVGFEMCEMLRMAGVEVALIIREEKFWENMMGKNGSDIIERVLKENGVRIINNAEVMEIKGGDVVESVVLKSGEEIKCDMALVSIGIFCPLEWIKNAGVETNKGVITNEFMETDIKDIWAAGDGAEYVDLIACEKTLTGNWTNARFQGEIAALNMTGDHKKFRYVALCNANGFGISVALIGNSKIGDDKKVVVREEKDKNSYGRIIIKGNKIIGAVLVNRPREVIVILKIIDKEIDVAGKEKELEDGGFDLKKIIKI